MPKVGEERQQGGEGDRKSLISWHFSRDILTLGDGAMWISGVRGSGAGQASRGRSKYKGPEVSVCLGCFKKAWWPLEQIEGGGKVAEEFWSM